MIFKGVDNLFVYCCNNPVMFVDETGYAKNFIITTREFYDISNRFLRFELGISTGSALNTSVIELESAWRFRRWWNSNAALSNHNDVIVIFTHGSPEMLEYYLSVYEHQSLNYMYCKAIILISCNVGNVMPKKNGNFTKYKSIAYYLSLHTSGYVVASDGTVSVSRGKFRYYFSSVADKGYREVSFFYLNLGWLVYFNGKFRVTNIRQFSLFDIVKYLEKTYKIRWNRV